MTERNKKNKFDYANKLRKNPTPSELIIWHKLKHKPEGIDFWSQFVLLGYIVDFYCPSAKTAIEIDGPIHEQQREQKPSDQ